MIGNATRDDFTEWLDLYGGDLGQWPPEAAEAAQRLLERDAACHALLAAARELDATLRRPPPPVDGARATRIQSAVMAALPSAPSRLGALMTVWRVEMELAALTLVAAGIVLSLLPTPGEVPSMIEQLLAFSWGQV